MHQSNLTRPQTVTLALGGLLSLAVAIGMNRFVYTPILPHMADVSSIATQCRPTPPSHRIIRIGLGLRFRNCNPPASATLTLSLFPAP